MKLIAKRKLIFKPAGAVGPLASKQIAEGTTFECDDDQAAKLIRNGDAVEKPKATRRAAATSETEDASA